MGLLYIKYQRSTFGAYVKLFVNDEYVVHLYHGETRTIDLPRGTHTLKVKQVGSSSRTETITISDMDDSIGLLVKDSLYHNIINIATFILFLLHFLIASPLGFKYLLYLAIPLLILNLYNILFQRDSWYYFESYESEKIEVLGGESSDQISFKKLIHE